MAISAKVRVILGSLDRIDADLQASSIDPNLSGAGRQARFDALSKERADLQMTAIEVTRAEWKNVRKRADDIAAKYRQASEDEARGWDFQRLNYERQRAHDAIEVMARHNGTIQDVAREFQRVKLEGDKHTQRSWAESAAIVERLWPQDHERGFLIREMQQHAESLTTSKDMQRLMEASTQNVKDAAELEEATRTFAKHWAGFENIRDGVSVVQRVDPSDLHIKATLEFA